MIFAHEGARVVATDVNDALLRRRSQRSMKRAEPRQSSGLKQKHRHGERLGRRRFKAVEAFGNVDTLTNNAGIPGQTRKDVWDIHTDETIRMLNVNILGTLVGCCDAEMKKNGTGFFVNISSVAGLVGGVRGGPSKIPMGFAARPDRHRQRRALPRRIAFVTGIDIIIDGGYAAQ